MFSKILIANRGVRAIGADASAADCCQRGDAALAGKRAPEAQLV